MFYFQVNTGNFSNSEAVITTVGYTATVWLYRGYVIELYVDMNERLDKRCGRARSSINRRHQRCRAAAEHRRLRPHCRHY